MHSSYWYKYLCERYGGNSVTELQVLSCLYEEVAEYPVAVGLPSSHHFSVKVTAKHWLLLSSLGTYRLIDFPTLFSNVILKYGKNSFAYRCDRSTSTVIIFWWTAKNCFPKFRNLTSCPVVGWWLFMRCRNVAVTWAAKMQIVQSLLEN